MTGADKQRIVAACFACNTNTFKDPEPRSISEGSRVFVFAFLSVIPGGNLL